jgi:hypothetical protein
MAGSLPDAAGNSALPQAALWISSRRELPLWISIEVSHRCHGR